MNELLREILFNLPLYDTVLQKLLAGDLYEGFPKNLVLTQVQILWNARRGQKYESLWNKVVVHSIKFGRRRFINSY